VGCATIAEDGSVMQTTATEPPAFPSVAVSDDRRSASVCAAEGHCTTLKPKLRRTEGIWDAAVDAAGTRAVWVIGNDDEDDDPPRLEVWDVAKASRIAKAKADATHVGFAGAGLVVDNRNLVQLGEGSLWRVQGKKLVRTARFDVLSAWAPLDAGRVVVLLEDELATYDVSSGDRLRTLDWPALVPANTLIALDTADRPDVVMGPGKGWVRAELSFVPDRSEVAVLAQWPSSHAFAGAGVIPVDGGAPRPYAVRACAE
jgi:hypothetical protein